MKYNSAYLWEKSSCEEAMPISVLLQQVCVKKRNVLFACVCEGKSGGEPGVTESGYFTEGLVEWFHREGLLYCEKKGEPEALKRLLEKEVKRLLGEVQCYVRKRCVEFAICYSGIFMWDNHFILFSMGDGKAYLLNRRFQKKNMRCIPIVEDHTGIGWMYGDVQHKVGILLCTSAVFGNLKEEEVAEVLLTDGEPQEERMEKRLKELWKENTHRGEERSLGVVFIRT